MLLDTDLSARKAFLAALPVPTVKLPFRGMTSFHSFSWILLKGRCRKCKKSISILYPFIELLTGVVTILVATLIDSQYQLGYGIFFSALIVTIRTDFERMLISRYMTWCMVPVAFLLCLTHRLPLTLTASIIGTIGDMESFGLLPISFIDFARYRA